MSEVREQFGEVVAVANASLTGDEVLLAMVDGEDSDFVRFNGESIRQAGSVQQRDLMLDLIDGQRHTSGSLSLSGDPTVDGPRAAALVAQLREQRQFVPDDPYLLYATDATPVVRTVEPTLPDAGEAVDRVLTASKGRDLVGVYASGTTFAGFANSLGLQHWSEGGTFNLDWSFYLHGDKAAKNLYAGTAWDDEAFGTKVEWSARQLEALERTPIDLKPGGYRTYLAPAAMQELVDILSWGGFGLKAHRTKQTPFLRMITDGEQLDPSVRISEDVANGNAPAFQSAGFAKPDEVVLIEAGQYVGHLVSPRSAQEYGVATNGAENWETPMSLAIGPGSLPAADVLEAIGTGLYVGNLWYLNYSDRAACRTTGMTRFATFWIEDGEIAAPVNVLRYDDTIYHLLGSRLAALTDTAETILDPSTYGSRSTASYRLPGALVEEMTFTL